MKDVYKDVDCDISIIKDKIISVIGYGIQGRAQSLNLRDSGANVIIGNIDDKYKKIANNDGFEVLSIKDSVLRSDIILFLIPDESQSYIFDKYIRNNLSDNNLIIFAHGYSIRFNKIDLPKGVDFGLLAPRFPGEPIRNNYLNNKGVPAFIDIIQDSSGETLNKIIAVGSLIGYGRVGMLPVSYIHETELDLFIEHFIGPLFIGAIEKSLYFLTKNGYSDVSSALELYLSGERGSMWTAYARNGLFSALNDNASPTCKFGISSYYNETFNDQLDKQMKIVLDSIKNGTFAKKLELEEKNGYVNVSKFFQDKKNSKMSKAELKVKELLTEFL